MGPIKLLYMDVDGTLTDGKIYIGDNGEVCKAFNIKDGYGIRNILPQYGIVPVVITARESGIVNQRCKELQISEVFQGCSNKKQKMLEIAEKYGLRTKVNGMIEKTAYVGDDIIDIPCMKIAEFAACPSDAAEEVKKLADFICSKGGGEGAVREVIDWMTAHAEKM